jgi:hypothetical protein
VIDAYEQATRNEIKNFLFILGMGGGSSSFENGDDRSKLN